MKKKVVIGLAIFSFIFLIGGIYIITTIETATSKLDNLIKLHQVEILREQLLIEIKRVQSDLNLKNTRFARGIDIVVANVRNMENVSNSCFNCHHTKDVFNRLIDIRNGIEEYEKALSRVMTISANDSRLNREEDRAFIIGEELVSKVNNMISMASIRLEEKTRSSLIEIASTKTVLYLLVGFVPLLSGIVGYFFIRGFTKPVNKLLDATQMLEKGDLEYRIGGLKDEFGIVADSFNQMAASLKQHMHKIEESEKRYRTLFDSAGDAIFILDAEGEDAGKIVAANQAAAEMHGHTVDELMNLNLIKDIITPDSSQDKPKLIEHMLSGKRIKAEVTHRRKDGTIFPVEISAGLFLFLGCRYILAFDRDITGRKEMEELILQSKLDWEDTFNTITDMITIHDINFNIIHANKSAEKILELSFLNTSRSKCFEYYHGMNHPPEECPSCECLKTGEPVSVERFEPHLNMYLEIRAMPRIDKNNQITGLIHVIRDITERKRVEEALQRGQQMKMVGEWAAGLVHEIKNSLAGIKVSVELLCGELNTYGKDRSDIYGAIDEIKKIEYLLKNLLNFAKPPKPQLMITDINDLLHKTIAFSLKHPLLSPGRSSAATISKDFQDNLPSIMADPIQLQQVFLNLLFNASEAMEGGGAMFVKTSYDSMLNAVQVEISDTGNGIDDKVLEEIFHPFFTTKSKGTGLGLAITKGLIEQHEGYIKARNRPGGGAIFIVMLPVKQTAREQVT